MDIKEEDGVKDIRGRTCSKLRCRSCPSFWTPAFANRWYTQHLKLMYSLTLIPCSGVDPTREILPDFISHSPTSSSGHDHEQPMPRLWAPMTTLINDPMITWIVKFAVDQLFSTWNCIILASCTQDNTRLVNLANVRTNYANVVTS